MRALALFWIITAPCFAQQRPTDSASRARDADERAVQAAAIDTLIAKFPGRVVLLMETTASHSIDSIVAQGMPGAAWADFRRQAAAARLVRPLPTRGVVQITTQSRANLPMQPHVTGASVVTLSAVGFSPSRDEAIIYVDHSCGSLCGSTALQAFRRQGTRWVLTAQYITSMR